MFVSIISKNLLIKLFGNSMQTRLLFDPGMQPSDGEITFCLHSHKNKLDLGRILPVYNRNTEVSLGYYNVKRFTGLDTLT